MRLVQRTDLSARVKRYLSRKQHEVDKGKDPRKTWERSRQTAMMADVFRTLQKMSGPRARCMFCEDSRGSDIDHLWPLSPYKERVFQWRNMLLSCADCNRTKTNKFDLDDNGEPLLIDPTSEDPWEFLVYVPGTDMLIARVNVETQVVHRKGEYTVSHVRALNYQCVTDGRGRTRRNLRRAVAHFLDEMSRGAEQEVATSELLRAVCDNDDYGLVQWFFRREGRDDWPFAELRASYPAVWEKILMEV